MKDDAERYIALANLKKLDSERMKGFDWLIRGSAWGNGFDEALVVAHVDEFWNIIRAIAVLDWTLRQPEHALAVKMEEPHLDAGAKFETIIRKAQKLALQIQEEQGAIPSPPVN